MTVAEPGPPRAFLADFGLAKTVATHSKLTRTGQALGTPAYMSPEQARGEVSSLTPATDVWSLGCVLYEMLAGRAAFGGESPAAVVGRVLVGMVEPIRRSRPDVPGDLERVLRACLAQDARRRPAEAAAVRDDLERILRGERARARPPRRRGTLALGLAAVAILPAAALLAGAVGDRAPRGASERFPSRAALPSLSRAESLVARARALRVSDPEGAARLLAEALDLAGAGPPDGFAERDAWLLEQGLLLWALGREDEASSAWARIPASSPLATRARLYRGLVGFFSAVRPRAPDGEGWKALCEVAAGPTEERGLAEAAVAAARKDWAAARLTLTGIPGWEASLLRAYVECGDPRGDRERSVREYDRALGDGLRFGWAIFNRGSSRMLLGDARGAEADYDEALRLQPRSPHILQNRAIARRAYGNLAGVVEDLTEALRLAPGNPVYLVDRASARRRLGDIPGALEDYASALEANPGDALAHFNRGILRTDLGEYQAAAEDYEAAVRGRPDDPDLWCNLGGGRRLLGDLPGAEEALRRALGLKRDHVEARGELGLLQMERGEWREAADSLREALRISPDHPEAAAIRAKLAECEAKVPAGGAR
ncbi:MAG: tetratricopeptide repeat-containing serine/threonine-protein kinase [Planctomycetales bacterium]|nr:tetratricopeptide repeat-containing serine/threonine-protein kinase [Planctomycetales bacterium]